MSNQTHSMSHYPGVHYCNYCALDPETADLRAMLEAIYGCNNCQADLLSNGDWTGYGKAAIACLILRFGRATVEAMAEKIEGEKKR